MNWIINGCWILSKAFAASIEIILWFLSLNLLICCITLIYLHNLKNFCIPIINPTWSWCMSFLICCWILFTKILLRFLHLCSSVILACSFLFIVLSLSGFCIRVMMALWPCRMSLEMFLPLLFFEIILEGIGISSSLNTTQILNTHRSTNIWR